ncbi:MAG TPA: NAD-dependent epimerase/dehydratase family protein, partial [Acidobacteriaceae bacterium]|nr:NAD-dependent epimerase/dehydratase family protein [Acidobacteriaceae bacterium]
MRIVLPGGSGHVGTSLARHFHAQGHVVTVLSRTPSPMPWRVVEWDYARPGAWVDELEGSDVCINLTGKSVNCRYNAANRREIYDSRIQPTQRLNETIAGLRNPPRIWLNAATATIYRHALDRAMDEATGELGGGEPGVPETWNFS